MTQSEYDQSARIIGNEMNKFNNEDEVNFGFISQDSISFRIFLGGCVDNLARGFALGLTQFCEMTQNDEMLIDEIANDAKRILADRKSMPLQ